MIPPMGFLIHVALNVRGRGVRIVVAIILGAAIVALVWSAFKDIGG